MALLGSSRSREEIGEDRKGGGARNLRPCRKGVDLALSTVKSKGSLEDNGASDQPDVSPRSLAV